MAFVPRKLHPHSRIITVFCSKRERNSGLLKLVEFSVVETRGREPLVPTRRQKRLSRFTDQSNEGNSCRSIFVSTRLFPLPRAPPIIPLSRWKNIFRINFQIFQFFSLSLSLSFCRIFYHERIVN